VSTTDKTTNFKRSYSTGPQVRQRYGGRSEMWLWRKLKKDPRFPRPLVMSRNLRLFDDHELDAYDEMVRAFSKTGSK
jgi:predicted DNA-binding transcriptional regulator AlpA